MVKKAIIRLSNIIKKVKNFLTDMGAHIKSCSGKVAPLSRENLANKQKEPAAGFVSRRRDIVLMRLKSVGRNIQLRFLGRKKKIEDMILSWKAKIKIAAGMVEKTLTAFKGVIKKVASIAHRLNRKRAELVARYEAKKKKFWAPQPIKEEYGYPWWFTWDDPIKNFIYKARYTRNWVTVKGPFRIFVWFGDTLEAFKEGLRVRTLDRIWTRERQAEIRWDYIQIEWKFIKKPANRWIFNPLERLWHAFHGRTTETAFKYYCLSMEFLLWFSLLVAVKLYWVGFTDEPSKMDRLIYTFLFWNFMSYWAARRWAWWEKRSDPNIRYLLFRIWNFTLYIVFFWSNLHGDHDYHIKHHEAILNPIYWLDRYIPFFTADMWDYFVEHIYAHAVIWYPVFFVIGLYGNHFINEKYIRGGILYYKSTFFETKYESKQAFWAAFKRDFRCFFDGDFLLYLNTAGLGIIYYIFFFIYCGPVHDMLSWSFVGASLLKGIYIVTWGGRLFAFIIFVVAFTKFFFKYIYITDSLIDERARRWDWDGTYKRYFLPFRSALTAAFLYAVPFYLTVVMDTGFASTWCLGRFLAAPNYYIYWLLFFITFFLVGAVAAAYRADSEYAAIYAFNCSAFITALFLCFTVYYRISIVTPTSDAFGARYVLFDIGKHVYNDYYSEFLYWGYDYLTLIMCLMTSCVFLFTFYVTVGSKEPHTEWTVLWLLLAEFLALGAFLSLNLFSFTILFEALVIPFVAIITHSGSSTSKALAAKQLAIYSTIGGAFMLVATLYIYSIFSSTNIVFVTNYVFLLTANERLFLFTALVIAFAVKTPLFPFHTWLLNAHVEAPTAASIILASILLKLGVYGYIRFVVGLFPDMVAKYGYLVVALALLGMVYSAVCALTETDCKRIVAYSSIGHMGLCVAGLFVCDPKAIYGAIFMMVGHAITSFGLFFVVGMMYLRTGTRDVRYFGGLAMLMPLASTYMFICVLFNSGFPLSISFLGEFFLLTAVMQNISLFGFILIAFSCLVQLAAGLRMFSFTCYGSPSPYRLPSEIKDVSFEENLALFAAVCVSMLLLFYNNHYFWPLCNGQLGEYLYTSQVALEELREKYIVFKEGFCHF